MNNNMVVVVVVILLLTLMSSLIIITVFAHDINVILPYPHSGHLVNPVF